MTNVVPFGKGKKIPTVKKVHAAGEDGVELDPPSREELTAFIRVINYLTLQSETNAVDINVMADEITVVIKHHDDLFEGGDVVSASSLELFASCPYDANATDNSKLINDLLVVFDRLDLTHYDEDEV